MPLIMEFVCNNKHSNMTAMTWCGVDVYLAVIPFSVEYSYAKWRRRTIFSGLPFLIIGFHWNQSWPRTFVVRSNKNMFLFWFVRRSMKFPFGYFIQWSQTDGRTNERTDNFNKVEQTNKQILYIIKVFGTISDWNIYSAVNEQEYCYSSTDFI